MLCLYTIANKLRGKLGDSSIARHLEETEHPGAAELAGKIQVKHNTTPGGDKQPRRGETGEAARGNVRVRLAQLKVVVSV